MRNRGVVLLLAILAVLGGTIGTATATPAGRAAPVADPTSATANGKPVPDDPSVQLNCGNTFNPPAPQGAPMTHDYKNCNGYALKATTGYQDATGQITVFLGGAVQWVPNQGEVGWFHTSTLSNVTYSTIIVP